MGVGRSEKEQERSDGREKINEIIKKKFYKSFWGWHRRMRMLKRADKEMLLGRFKQCHL